MADKINIDRNLLYYKGLFEQARQRYEKAKAVNAKEYVPPARKKKGDSIQGLVSRLASFNEKMGIPKKQAKSGAMADATQIWFAYPHRDDLSR